MSNRNMSRLYQAGGGNTATPEGLDLFGMRHRRQLETMQLQNQLQQKLIDAEAAHEEALQKLKHEHDNDTITYKQASDYMSKNGLMDTPENRKATNDTLFQQQLQNAKQQTVNQYRGLMNAGGALDQDQNPNIRNANNVGANAAAMGIDLNKLNTTTPLGGTSVMPSIPGLGMNQIQGATTKQEPMLYGGFYDKATGKMMDQKLGERNQMIPGRVITAPQMRPMSPNELPSNPNGPDGQSQQQLDSNGFFPPAGINTGAGVRNPPLSTMSQMSPPLNNGAFMNDAAGRQDISPTPGDQSTTPSGSALSPQWPPRSGLIPGGYDVIGNLIKENLKSYGDELSPFLQALMGKGFTLPNSNTNQITTTPQY